MEEQSKKDIAVSFLQLATSGDVQEAYQQYIHPDFFHHNPYFKGDRQSLIDGMLSSAKEYPNKTIMIERTLEDGDLVTVHSRIQLQKDSSWISLIHIFRFEDNLIVEEWEASQMIPEDIVNENGLF